MTAKAILDELKSLGSESYKRVILKHGVTEPCYEVNNAPTRATLMRVRVRFSHSTSFDVGQQVENLLL